MDLQKNTPNSKKNQQANIEYRRVVYRHGPLPEAQELARYEQAYAGAAGRIIRMAERQQKISYGLDILNWLGGFVTMLVTRGFLYFLVVASFMLVMRGKEVAALLTAMAPIVSVFTSSFRDFESKK